MSIRRKTGWVADQPHERPSGRYAAPAGASTTPWSIHQHVQEIPDQGQLGACTGVSTVHAIQTLCAMLGLPAILGSALAAYWGARLNDYLASNRGASVASFEAQDTDAGSSHASLFQAMQQLGLPPESAWPYSDQSTGSPKDPFRERPSAEAMRLAFDARDIQFLALDGEDPAQKIIDLNHAGASGTCVVAIGILVDEVFCSEAFDPTVAYTPDVSKPVGGHALYLTGMRINPQTGAREYEVAMSWGAGPFSFAWLSEACVLDPTTQLTVIQHAPVVVSGGAS